MAKQSKPNATPERLRVAAAGRPIGVDREARVIRGYVVALAGPFKSDGRGEFDRLSLEKIVELWPESSGLKSRFAHPNESSDGLGKFLGRAHKPFLSKATVMRGGNPVEVDAVRADLHLDASAFETPNGNLGEYILKLAESDSDALSSSLVLRTEKEWRKDEHGRPALGSDGEPLPPLWRPRELAATDVVDEGDAVDGFLSHTEATRRPTREYLARGESILNELFANQPRRVVRARLMAYLNRYLDRRYGNKNMSANNGNGRRDEALGPALGGLLDDMIEAAASDERPREVIIAQMAEESGMPVDEVSRVIQGEDLCPPLAALQAFAKVLEMETVGELILAAEQDGCDYTGATDEGDQKEPPAGDQPPAGDAPPAGGGDAPAPMSRRHTGVLARELALKEKIS